MTQFENTIRQDLHQYLLSQKEIDKHLPNCPDVEDKWEEIAKAYLPDGIREFNAYPTSSLGWMMYIGMAVTKYWDDEWEIYGRIEDLYAYIRDKRGYDALDEYVREEVLQLTEQREQNQAGLNSAESRRTKTEGQLTDSNYDALEKLVGECASRTHNMLRRQGFEPGTKAAFDGYVSCLHQLYLMGMSVQLYRMGYHMEKM